MSKIERELKEILEGKNVKYDKDYYVLLKELKKLCIYHFGLGFIFATPKVRSILYESEISFLDWIVEGVKSK